MDGGSCCRGVALRQLEACSWRWSVGLLGCRLAGRKDGDEVGREVPDGGVIDDEAKGKGAEWPDVKNLFGENGSWPFG
mgnify:CR=1 FL=1